MTSLQHGQIHFPLMSIDSKDLDWLGHVKFKRHLGRYMNKEGFEGYGTGMEDWLGCASWSAGSV